jgi:O-antigen/teichoic acid export membrane protein
MRRKLIGNVTAEFAGRIIHAAIAGVLLVFLARTLGSESYGVYALALSIFAISRLFSELGIAPSAARFIAEFKGDQPGAADVVVAESKKFAIAASVAIALLLVVAADWIAALLNEPTLSIVIVVGSGYVLFYSLHRYNRILLQGYEEMRKSAALHTLEAVLTGIFVVVFVLYRPTAVAAVAGYAVGFGAVMLVGFYAVDMAREPTQHRPVSRTEIRRHILKYNVPLTVTRQSEVLDREVDVLLVGFFLNPFAVAFYMIGKELSRLVSLPAASIGFALSPTLGADKAAGQQDNAAAVYGEIIRKVLIFYIPACAGIFLVAGVVIPEVFGAEYAGAIPVVQILSLFVFFEALAYVSDYTLDFLGRASTRAIAKSLTSFGNFGLNLLLIPVIGVEGAALATVITHGLYSLATVYLVYDELAFDLAPVGGCLVRVSILTIIMGIIVFTLVQTFSGYVAIVGGIVAGAGTWLFGCHVLELFNYRQLVMIIQD